jgi:hypothetical protein
MHNNEIVEMWLTEEELRSVIESVQVRVSRESVQKKPMGKIMSDKVRLPLYCYYNEHGRLVTVYEKQEMDVSIVRVR